jgi:hypothetical protein
LDLNSGYILIVLSAYIAFLFFKKFYLPKIYGSLGEYQVARILSRLDKNDYIVYNNIYLKSGERTSQIDHLVISIYGIFVIETKNYKGWIFGNEKSKYWTQTLFRKKHKIFNPVIQNWTHINFLKNISRDLRGSFFFPIVVFAGNAKLKNVDSSTPVIYKRQLLRVIRSQKEVLITHNQLANIEGIIRAFIQTGAGVRKEHRKNVKNTISRNGKNSNIRICPSCGGKLEPRNGKFGPFLGCSNFPRCKFTSKLK